MLSQKGESDSARRHLVLGNFLDEFHFHIGHRLTVDLALRRLPFARVVVDELPGIEGGSGTRVGQNAGCRQIPLIATPGPQGFAEPASRIEEPRTYLLLQRVPADNLRDGQGIVVFQIDSLFHHEKVLILVPFASHIDDGVFAFAGPIIRATDSEYASAGGNSASLVPRLVKFSVHSSTIRANRLKGLSSVRAAVG